MLEEKNEREEQYQSRRDREGRENDLGQKEGKERRIWKKVNYD